MDRNFFFCLYIWRIYTISFLLVLVASNLGIDILGFRYIYKGPYRLQIRSIVLEKYGIVIVLCMGFLPYMKA